MDTYEMLDRAWNDLTIEEKQQAIEGAKSKSVTKDNSTQHQIWEDILYRFATQVMHRKEKDIINDLSNKYTLVINNG